MAPVGTRPEVRGAGASALQRRVIQPPSSGLNASSLAYEAVFATMLPYPSGHAIVLRLAWVARPLSRVCRASSASSDASLFESSDIDRSPKSCRHPHSVSVWRAIRCASSTLNTVPPWKGWR